MNIINDNMEVLKNFATIQPNLLIEKGNVIRTINDSQDIIAKYTLSESNSDEIAIYDMNEFLNCLSLFKNAEVTVNDAKNAVIVCEGGKSLKYLFASKNVLKTLDKDINMPSSDVKLTLTANNIIEIKRAVSVLKSEGVAFTSDGTVEVIGGTVGNSSGTSDTTKWKIDVDMEKEQNAKFKLIIKPGFLNILIPGDYSVELSKEFISQWSNNTTEGLQYWAGVERESHYSS